MATNWTQTPDSPFYIKTQKYLHRRYHAVLARAVDKKQEEKDIMDVEKARNLLDIFQEDLLGIPSVRQPEFKNQPKCSSCGKGLL